MYGKMIIVCLSRFKQKQSDTRREKENAISRDRKKLDDDDFFTFCYGTCQWIQPTNDKMAKFSRSFSSWLFLVRQILFTVRDKSRDYVKPLPLLASGQWPPSSQLISVSWRIRNRERDRNKDLKYQKLLVFLDSTRSTKENCCIRTKQNTRMTTQSNDGSTSGQRPLSHHWHLFRFQQQHQRQQQQVDNNARPTPTVDEYLG